MTTRFSELDFQGQLFINFERTPLELRSPDELYEEANEELLRKLYEDCRLELKPARQHARALGAYFSMWANTAPAGGLIVVGIREDKIVEGCAAVASSQLNTLELTGEVYCSDAAYTHKRVAVHRDADGVLDYVLLFRVKYHPTRVVRTSDHKVFVRKGNRKYELTTPEEIGQLKADKGEVQVEAEACGLDYPKQFDEDSIRDFVATVRAKKGWSDSHSIDDILALLHLGVRDGRKFVPNVACAMLFAKEPRRLIPGCRVRLLRFEGETEMFGEKRNAVKDEFIDGTVPSLINQAVDMVRSQLRMFSRLDKGGRFFTTPEYPEFAWYEAIVNACVHRAYGNGMKNMPVFIKMFDDRLEVESPGPFPPFVTKDNVYEVHAPRNPYLMEAMYYLEFVKMAHEGTRRMRELMLRDGLPAPEFKQEEIGHLCIRVTLRNNIKHRRVWVDADVAALLGAQIASLLSEKEKRCINFCAENGKINVNDAVRLIGGDWRTMKKLLDGLVEKRILEREHKKERDPHAHYRLRGAPARK